MQIANSGGGRSRTSISSRAVFISVFTLVVIFMTYVRLPPRVTLLNNPQTKQVLVELKNSKRIEELRARQQQKDHPQRVVRLHDSEDEYNESDEDTANVEKIPPRLSNSETVISDESANDDEDNDQNTETQLAEVQSITQKRTKWDIDPADTERKYFVYQPSGGWGNQRMILRWAMRLANAMGRTLIVPMVAPHNKMWYGYDRLNASEMVVADRVLDMDALEAGTVQGVRVHRGHLSTLPTILRGTWRRNSKRSLLWLTENMIKSKWKGTPYQVVFFNRGSMWECCAGGTMMTPYVMFSRELKEFSLEMANLYFKSQPYNAVHVRRGGGHTRIDRRTAQHYLEMKIIPAGFDKNLPIFVATDEKVKTWFEYWRSQGYRYLFWNDLANTDPARVSKFLSSFPARMHNDIIGFIEQLICGRAVKWTGSDGSTFSYSIEGMRNFPTLVRTDWKSQMDSQTKRIYAYDGRGVNAPSKEAEAEQRMEAHDPLSEEESSNTDGDDAQSEGSDADEVVNASKNDGDGDQSEV